MRQKEGTSSLTSRTARLSALAFPVAAYLLYAIAFYLWQGYPLPSVHDEFSYILAADTFSHLRFANPTPPAWQSFESIHINMVPTYVSMYPPAQGLFLAIGQILTGHPWWGVVLSGALFLLAAGWAFRAWLPGPWAFAATLVTMCFLLGTYWTKSYWGGNVTALAGALVLGAVGYIRTRNQVSDWVLWAAGCSLLICARPYSGSILILLSVAKLIRIFLLRRRTEPQGSRSFIRAFSFGALPTATLAILWVAAYCQSTTGKPYIFPYIENVRQYQIRRSFHWQKDHTPPPYRHASMEKVYRGLLRKEIPLVEQYKGMATSFVNLYGGNRVLVAGLLFLPFAWGAGYRWVLLSTVIGFAAILCIPYIHPHYYAAYSAFLVLSWVQGVRSFYDRKLLGYTVSLVAVILLAAVLVLQLARKPFRPLDTPDWVVQRDSLIRKLSSSGEKHLILVDYDANHSFHKEWVYNPADFASAPVLWARWWTPQKNLALAQAYPDRKLWVLHPDRSLELQPYNPEGNR